MFYFVWTDGLTSSKPLGGQRMKSCKGVKCDKSGLEFPIYFFLVIKRVGQIRCSIAEVFQEVDQKYHYSIV